MPIKTKLIMIAVILALALYACASPGEPSSDNAPETAETEISTEAESESQAEPAKITLPGIDAGNYPIIDGSTANMPLMAALYSAVCGVSLDDAETMVQASGGTGAAWRSLQYSEVEMLIIYEAPEEVKAELVAEGIWDELEITPIGRDGLVFLVNKQNPVNDLTQGQLIDIYTGGVTDWSEIGGDKGPVAAFQRNTESGSQTLFQKLLMKDVTPMDPPSELRPMGMGELIDMVSDYDGSGGAIGFSVYYYASLMNESDKLKLLSVDGVAPSAKSIGDGSYPLTNEFYVVIRKSEPESSPARVMRDWLLTDQGRDLMQAANYVPIG